MTRLDRLVADGLHQEALAHARADPARARRGVSRTKRQVARSKTCFFLIDGLNDQSKSSSGLQLAEQRRLDAPLQLAVGPHRQFVLQDQFQELGVAQAVAGGLLQPHLQALQQPGEAQLLQGTTQGTRS